MRRIKKCFHYLYMICWALIPPRKVSSSNNVLIAATGHVGDVVSDASAWSALIEQGVSKGKNISVLATREAWNTFCRFLKTDRIRYIERCKETWNIQTLKDAYLTLKGTEFETIAVRMHADIKLYLLAAMLPAKSRYIVVEKESISTAPFYAIYRLFKRRYTSIIIEDENSSEKQALEKFMHAQGYDDYRMQIVPLPRQAGAVDTPCRSYITIAVDSQSTDRRWPEERFVALVDELLGTVDEDIILTGSFLDDEAARRYDTAFHGNERVKSTIGRLDFDHWIELLRGARFHIGVDSGSIHIAAAVGTVAFCLAGYWQTGRFFPYQDDMIGPGTAMPICIYRKDVGLQELDCSGCGVKGKVGDGDRACKKQIRRGEPRVCLTKIQVCDVMDAIKTAIGQGMV